MQGLSSFSVIATPHFNQPRQETKILRSVQPLAWMAFSRLSEKPQFYTDDVWIYGSILPAKKNAKVWD